MLHLKKPVETEIEIKKSRFIGMLFPVENEQQARETLALVRKQHPSATHHCTAMIVGNIQRSNDDGEPSGTAGLPMLECLRHEDLDNVLAIVVRYFGGTLLGTGGLVRAYQQSVTSAIKLAELTEPVTMQEYEVILPYDLYSRADQLLRKNATVEDTDFSERITVRFLSEKNLDEQFMAISSGTVRPQYLGDKTVEREIKK